MFFDVVFPFVIFFLFSFLNSYQVLQLYKWSETSLLKIIALGVW